MKIQVLSQTVLSRELTSVEEETLRETDEGISLSINQKVVKMTSFECRESTSRHLRGWTGFLRDLDIDSVIAFESARGTIEKENKKLGMDLVNLLKITLNRVFEMNAVIRFTDTVNFLGISNIPGRWLEFVPVTSILTYIPRVVEKTIDVGYGRNSLIHYGNYASIIPSGLLRYFCLLVYPCWQFTYLRETFWTWIVACWKYPKEMLDAMGEDKKCNGIDSFMTRLLGNTESPGLVTLYDGFTKHGPGLFCIPRRR